MDISNSIKNKIFNSKNYNICELKFFIYKYNFNYFNKFRLLKYIYL